MSVELTVNEICDTIRALPEDQLDQVLQLLRELEQGTAACANRSRLRRPLSKRHCPLMIRGI